MKTKRQKRVMKVIGTATILVILMGLLLPYLNFALKG